MTRTLAPGLALSLALLTGAAHAQTFQSRDLNGDGTADAYFNPTYNLTWLADANLYATQGHPTSTLPWGEPTLPGQMLHATAVSWVDGLNVYGVDDWRLPIRLPPIGSDNPMCDATSCNPVASWPTELGHLSALLATNANPFANVQSGSYMTTTYGGWLEYRTLLGGSAGITDETSLFFGYVLPVRTGDVSVATAPVPEPGTYLLMLGGLAATGLAWRRRRRR